MLAILDTAKHAHTHTHTHTPQLRSYYTISFKPVVPPIQWMCVTIAFNGCSMS